MTYYAVDPNRRHKFFNQHALADSRLETDSLPCIWAAAQFQLPSSGPSKNHLLSALQRGFSCCNIPYEGYFCRKLPLNSAYYCFVAFKDRVTCSEFCSRLYLIEFPWRVLGGKIELQFSPVFSPLSRSILCETQILAVGGNDSSSWHLELSNKILSALCVPSDGRKMYESCVLGNPGDSMIQVLLLPSTELATQTQGLGFVRVQNRIVSLLPVSGTFAYRTATHSLLVHPVPTDVDVDAFDTFLRTLQPVPVYWRRVTFSPENVWVHFSFPAYPHFFENIDFGSLSVRWHEYNSDYAKKLIVKAHTGFPWCVDASIQEKIAVETLRQCDFTAIPSDPLCFTDQFEVGNKFSGLKNSDTNQTMTAAPYYGNPNFKSDMEIVSYIPKRDEKYCFISEIDSVLRCYFPFYIPPKIKCVFEQTGTHPNQLSVRNGDVRTLLQLPLAYGDVDRDF